jgi:hypothetical protein
MEFKNVYLGLPKEHKLRTTFEAALTDVAFLRSFDPKEGNLQTTLSLLLTKLKHELAKSNIQPGDFSTYQHAVANCSLVLGHVQDGTLVINGVSYVRADLHGGTTSDSPARTKRARPAKTTGRDVGRGDTTMAQQAA